MNHTLLYRFSLLVIVVALGISFFRMYELLVPTRILDLEEPIEILTPVVKAGDAVTYQTKYCKYKELPATFVIELSNDTTIFKPPAVSNKPAGCGTSKVSTGVPDYAIPGTYKIIIHVEYEVSSLRTVRMQFTSEEFEVIK